HVLAGLLLELGNRPGGVVPNQLGGSPVCGVKCPGDDDLVQGVHLRGDRRVVLLGGGGRPVSGHQLVGDPPEQQRVSLLQLTHGKLVELRIHDRPIEGLTGALIVAVEAGEMKRQQLPHRDAFPRTRWPPLPGPGTLPRPAGGRVSTLTWPGRGWPGGRPAEDRRSRQARCRRQHRNTPPPPPAVPPAPPDAARKPTAATAARRPRARSGTVSADSTVVARTGTHPRWDGPP